MCVEVHNLETNETACTPRELSSMIEVDLYFLDKYALKEHGYSELHPDHCLCGLDIFSACNDAGFMAEFNKSFDIEIKKHKKE